MRKHLQMEGRGGSKVSKRLNQFENNGSKKALTIKANTERCCKYRKRKHILMALANMRIHK